MEIVQSANVRTGRRLLVMGSTESLCIIFLMKLLLTDRTTKAEFEAVVLEPREKLAALAAAINNGSIDIEVEDGGDCDFVSQIGICSLLFRYVAANGHPTLLSRQMNTIIAAADSILATLNSPFRPAPPGCGLDCWLKSDETGMSSLFVAGLLSGRTLYTPEGRCSSDLHHPRDAADFNRICVLLDAAPELRASLSKLASIGNALWADIFDNWAFLEDKSRKAATGDKSSGITVSEKLAGFSKEFR